MGRPVPWAPTEDAALREMMDAGDSWRAIGDAIGRSMDSCIHRAGVLGIKRDPAQVAALRSMGPGRASPDWTKAEDDRLIYLRRRDVPYAVIGEELKRTPAACQARFKLVSPNAGRTGSVPTRVKPTLTERKCLSCGSMFPSTWVGHRHCGCFREAGAIGGVEGNQGGRRPVHRVA